MSSKKALNAAATAAKAAAEAGLNSTSTSKHIWVNGDMVRNPKFNGPADISTAKSVTPNQMSDFIGQHAAGNHGAKIDDFSNGLRVNKPDGRPQVANMHEIPESMGGTGPNMGNYMTKKKPSDYMSGGSDYIKDKPFNPKDFYANGGGNIKSAIGNNGGRRPFGLSNDDINVIGFTGAAGGALGEGINSAMDDSYSAGKQNAQSYWTNKKNTDRGGK